MKHRNFPSSSKCKPSLKLLTREGVSVVLCSVPGAYEPTGQQPGDGHTGRRRAPSGGRCVNSKK